MIREIIKPTSNTYTLHLPNSMIGKTVEILAFDTDENGLFINNINNFNNLEKEPTNNTFIELCKKISTSTAVGKFNREELYD